MAEPCAGVPVTLLDVDAAVLGRLLDLAVLDAAPDDVTPPLGQAPGWMVPPARKAGRCLPAAGLPVRYG